MTMEHLDYTQARIFGNEAGEDEDPQILDSYFVSKPEFEPFEADSNSYCIIRGLRGTGKSALLSRVAFVKQGNAEKPLVIPIKGPELVAGKPFESKNSLEYIYEWQQRLCSRINAELGRDIGLALDDRAMALVEYSEISGFKGRNIVGALIERMSKKLGPVTLSPAIPQNANALLKDYLERHKDRKVWLLIDDIDATFTGSADEILRLSTFFSACRHLAHSIKSLNLRCSVRTDVWTMLNMHDESLDKCRQYIIDLEWSSNGTSLILTHRIRSFIQREYGLSFEDECDSFGYISVKDRERYLNLIFPKGYVWQDRVESPTKVIHILASGRPRMALRLCRMAGDYARKAQNKGHIPRSIKLELLRQIIKPFGRDSLRDLIAENKHQCTQLEDVVYAFSRTTPKFDTRELISLIESRLPSGKTVIIHDNRDSATSLEIAHFLFRIGFIAATDYVYPAYQRKYYKFMDKPNLLRTLTNLDDGLCWILHPPYAEALDIEIIKPRRQPVLKRVK